MRIAAPQHSPAAPKTSSRVRHLRLAGTQREIGRALAAAAEPPTVTLPPRGRRRPRASSGPPALVRAPPPGPRRADPRASPTTSASIPTTRPSRWTGSAPTTCPPAARSRSTRARARRTATACSAAELRLPHRHVHRDHRRCRPCPANEPLAADPWVIELHPDDGYASIVVGIMDVMGAMDGINEAGLAVALLADNETPEPEPTGAPAGRALRAAGRPLPARHAAPPSTRRRTPCSWPSTTTSSRRATSSSPTARADRSCGSTRRAATDEVIVEADPGTDGRLVCTNHLLHRWPDPSQLPDDYGPIGTAALTYHRWRIAAPRPTRASAVVDRDDIRDQFAAVRFAAPIEEARTFWQRHLRRGRRVGRGELLRPRRRREQRYSEPIRLSLSTCQH